MRHRGSVCGRLLGTQGATKRAGQLSNTVWIVGLGVVVLGGMTAATTLIVKAIAQHHRPASDAYEAGHQAGYDRGYCEGRRVARPVIVPGRRWSDDPTHPALEN